MTSKNKVVILPLVLGKQQELLPYLAMGMLTAYVRHYESGHLNDFYDISALQIAGHDENYPLKSVYKEVTKSPNPVCLFSSYVWNDKLNIKVAAHIKKISPGSLIIFGGPHVPKYDGETEKYLQENPQIDIAVLGEGEDTLAEILSIYAPTPRQKRELSKLANTPGLVYCENGEFTRTGERQRNPNVAEFPSPYLTGEFEPWFTNFRQANLETNRGCPYGCTYCDWGSATLAKVTKFGPDRVIAEMKYIAEKQAESIFITDANFGMLEQDITIAEELVAIRARTGYPKRLFTNFAKNGGRRLMAVIKILHEGGLLPVGVIALQTTDPIVLKAIERDNIKTEAYEKMMTYFNSENIPMASDLMIGLPGQTADSFASDLQFCFNWKVAATANYTSMMPNAPMAESSYKEEHQIVASDNDMIQSTATLSADDMAYMKELFTTYQFHIRFGVLKYILYYLQIEHDVPAIDFLRRWLRAAAASDPNLPISARLHQELIGKTSSHGDWAVLFWQDNMRFLFDDPGAYYDEILHFCEGEFGLLITGSEAQTLKDAQQAVMPRDRRKYPYKVSLEHDIGAYISQIKSAASVDMLDEDFKPLKQWPGNTLAVSAASEIGNTTFDTVVSHDDQWELESSLRFY